MKYLEAHNFVLIDIRFNSYIHFKIFERYFPMNRINGICFTALLMIATALEQLFYQDRLLYFIEKNTKNYMTTCDP